VNSKTFDINLSLFCCVSDKLQAICNQEEELNLTISKQHFPCFVSFLDIFRGLPFYFQDYSLESVSYLIYLFGLTSLSQFICKHLASPNNVQEALEFLSNHSCELYAKIFEQSLSILTSHFSEIRIENLNKLPNFILESLFQSPQFQIDNEDILFNLVIDLIKRNPNRKSLLKIIYFPAVSTSLLINYFNNFPVEDIDSNLFESFKARFFCDIIMPNSIPFQLRWEILQHHAQKKKSKKFSSYFKIIFILSTNFAELIKTLFREKEELKNQLQNVQSEKEKIKHENVQLKSQNQRTSNSK
jgi:hypothetical protein